MANILALATAASWRNIVCGNALCIKRGEQSGFRAIQMALHGELGAGDVIGLDGLDDRQVILVDALDELHRAFCAMCP